MNWKTEIARLRETARPVLAPPPNPGMGAREVARVLSGVAGSLARTHGVEAMQTVCAQLALDPAVFQSKFSTLPVGPDGKVDPKVEMVAMICRGLLMAASTDAVRAALSFWASEQDTAVWQSVVLAA